jgi:hypothetical protein
MSEIKTLAQKMEIGRHEKARRNGDPANFHRLRRAKSGFHYRGVFCYTYWERHPIARRNQHRMWCLGLAPAA